MASAVVRVRWQWGRTALMDGETALMNASKYGNVEVIKVLIDKGADVNFTNMVSAALAVSIARTAVWRACGYGG